ncbi:hypothetical protein SLS57_010026 [Botryosphaeria dothidea]
MPRRLSTAHSAGSLDSHTAVSQEKSNAASPYGNKLTVADNDGHRKRSHSLGAKDEPFSKKRKAESEFSPLESIRPMSTPQSPSTVEAQSYIQQELEAAKDLSSTRRTVLRSIGELINQLHGRVKVTIGARTDFNTTGTILQDIHYPPIEFLYWMLKEIRSNNLGFHVSYFVKHISPRSLEKMGIALVHQQEDQETLLLYSICVNSIAAKFLNTIISEESDTEMAQEVRVAIAKYNASAELAMSRIPLLASPSLTLLQALLCSAFICQGQGDTAACWTFTSAACKTCMDLGLHTGRGDFWDPQAEDNELYYCFVWCYMLDKSFSMNLGRRACLLDTDLVNSTESIWVHAPVNLLTIYLELARIQSVVVSDLVYKVTAENSTEQSQKSALIAKLIQQMHDFKDELDGMRKTPEKFRGLYMESELQALEFSYWSVMTAIRRCERTSSGSKTSVGEGCLEAARSAILSLQSLQKSQPFSNGKTKMSFVNWTLLFYPLTPFFVLFCNVVATSHRPDFALMKSMTDDLAELADHSPSIERLHRLFTVFLSLAEPLLDEDIDEGATEPNGRATSSTRRRQHRRQRNSHGQALDMYYKLKESSKPKPATRSSRRHNNPTSNPVPANNQAALPPPWDAGPYTSTFHLSDLSTPVPSTTTTTNPGPTAAATTTATISPSPAPSSSLSHAGSYAMNFSLPPEATAAPGCGGDVPFWELFDVQPSLDWLDVDLGSVIGGEGADGFGGGA